MDFPDADDLFELEHADELELLREAEEDEEFRVSNCARQKQKGASVTVGDETPRAVSRYDDTPSSQNQQFSTKQLTHVDTCTSDSSPPSPPLKRRRLYETNGDREINDANEPDNLYEGAPLVIDLGPSENQIPVVCDERSSDKDTNTQLNSFTLSSVNRPAEKHVELNENDAISATVLVGAACDETQLAAKTMLLSHNARETVSSLYDRFNPAHELAEEESIIPKARVWKRIPPGRFQPVTSQDNQRVYLRVRHERHLEDEGYKLSSQKTFHLLAVPYAELREEAEVVREKCLLRMGEEQELNAAATDGVKEECELWVEKYKPCSYMDLLSDDGTNRTLLHWLKLWDKLVFGRNYIRRYKPKVEANEAFRQNNKFKSFKKPTATAETTEELDDNGCPRQKVALLCGPPGLGKTTLAHVIAKQAGYNVIEMNASDDRSPDAFRTQIEAATQMKAVLGQDPRPNCLIIDEIDGAPSAAINVLIGMVTGKTSVNEEDKKKKKKKMNSGLLLRPIICICNDLYVASLRLLRQIALIVTFPPTLASRLALRLQAILRLQNLPVNQKLVSVLCEKAENDIRSCLSTLQFVFNRHKEGETVDIRSVAIGQKDIQKGLFDVWNQIFVIPRSNRKTLGWQEDGKGGAQSANENTSLAARFYSVLRTVQACGEFDKVFQGIYENYLTFRLKEADFEMVSVAADWVEFVDFMNTEIYKRQNFNLLPYLPYAAVHFHLSFATNNQLPKLQYPTSHFEFTAGVNRTVNVVSAMRADMCPQVRVFTNGVSMVTQLLPFLVTIVQPSLRLVNTQLYSGKEKADLARLVDIMIAYNLTYLQMKRAEDNQYTYVLEPNVEDVVCFPSIEPRQPMTYASKQLVAREIELEKMRRSEKSESPPTPPPPPQQLSDSQVSALPNHLQVLEPIKRTVAVDKPVLDFFGRVVVPPTPKCNEEGAVVSLSSSSSSSGGQLWFHFKEGFSNAVRRNIKVEDFL